MKIQLEKSSAPALPFVMCHLPLHFHDKVIGGGCIINFWRNTGWEILLRLLPSFLLTPLVRAAVRAPSNTPLQVLPPAPPHSHGLWASPAFSLPFPYSALYSYFILSTKSMWQAKSFSISNGCDMRKLRWETSFQKLTFKCVSWLNKSTSKRVFP